MPCVSIATRSNARTWATVYNAVVSMPRLYWPDSTLPRNAVSSHNSTGIDYSSLAADIKRWGRDCGFQQVGISSVDLAADEAHLLNWLAAERHGTMGYMARHGVKRSRPDELLAGTVRVVSVRMDYDPPGARDAWE